MESMMTARQVADLLGVHENWVYDQAASGQLPSYKLGGTRRFDPDELRGWIAEHRQARRDRRAWRAAVRETTAPAPKRRRNDAATKMTAAGQQPQPRLFGT
jgi:excisionase family DNA binding protein